MSVSSQHPESDAVETGRSDAVIGRTIWAVMDAMAPPPVVHDPGATFLGDLDFDSMRLVSMYMICEELFGIDLLESEAVVDLTSVGELIAHLDGLVATGAAHVPDETAIGPLLDEYA